MPRVNECLAAKQIEPTTPRTTTPSTSRSLIPAPGKPCANGCASFCVGPKCAGQKFNLFVSLSKSIFPCL